jgi:hypothetical protein
MYRVRRSCEHRSDNTGWRQGFMGPSTIYHSQSDWHSYNSFHLEPWNIDNGIVATTWCLGMKADIYIFILAAGFFLAYDADVQGLGEVIGHCCETHPIFIFRRRIYTALFLSKTFPMIRLYPRDLLIQIHAASIRCPCGLNL